MAIEYTWRWGVVHCSACSGWVQKVLWLMATRTCAVSSHPFKNCFSFNCFYIELETPSHIFPFFFQPRTPVRCFTLPVLEPLTLPRIFWKRYRQNSPELQITDPWEECGDKGMCSLLEVISFSFSHFFTYHFQLCCSMFGKTFLQNMAPALKSETGVWTFCQCEDPFYSSDSLQWFWGPFSRVRLP